MSWLDGVNDRTWKMMVALSLGAIVDLLVILIRVLTHDKGMAWATDDAHRARDRMVEEIKKASGQ